MTYRILFAIIGKDDRIGGGALVLQHDLAYAIAPLTREQSIAICRAYKGGDKAEYDLDTTHPMVSIGVQVSEGWCRLSFSLPSLGLTEMYGGDGGIANFVDALEGIA